MKKKLIKNSFVKWAVIKEILIQIDQLKGLQSETLLPGPEWKRSLLYALHQEIQSQTHEVHFARLGAGCCHIIFVSLVYV